MKKAKEKQNQDQFLNFEKEPVSLGPYTTHMWKSDPKHIVFMMARYKFVSKMLEGKNRVCEVGCGDAFATPIVAKVVGSVLCLDFEPLLMENNIQRLALYDNIDFELLDITQASPKGQFDACFSLDVIEHIKPKLEDNYFRNITNALIENGILIVGTPNKNAEKYASVYSRMGHINLKNHDNLKSAMNKYFNNVFSFSMNDEVLHTGFKQMAHYIFCVGVGKKKL